MVDKSKVSLINTKNYDVIKERCIQLDKSKVSLINTKNYDVIKERCIHHMIILTLLPLAHANVEINTFPMIYYKGFRNQN